MYPELNNNGALTTLEPKRMGERVTGNKGRVKQFPGGTLWPVFLGRSQSEELENKFPDFILLLPSNQLLELPWARPSVGSHNKEIADIIHTVRPLRQTAEGKVAEGAFGRAKERQQAPSHPPLKIIEKKRKKYLEKYIPT